MANGFINIHPEFYSVLKTFSRYRLGELVKTLMRKTQGEELPKTSELARAFAMLIFGKQSKGTDNVNIHGDYFGALFELSNYRVGELTLALIRTAEGEEVEKISPVAQVFLLQMCGKNSKISASLSRRAEASRRNGKEGGRPKKEQTQETQQNLENLSKSKSESESFSHVVQVMSSPVKADNDRDTNLHEQQLEMFKENIEYGQYQNEASYFRDYKHSAEALVSCVETVFAGTSPTVKIARQPMSRSVVIGRLLKLDAEHFLHALEKIKKHSGKIKSFDSYALTVLYKSLEECAFDVDQKIEIGFGAKKHLG